MEFKWLLHYSHLPDVHEFAVMRALSQSEENIMADSEHLSNKTLLGESVVTDRVAHIRTLLKAKSWITSIQEREAWNSKWNYHDDVLLAHQQFDQPYGSPMARVYLYNLILVKAGALRILESVLTKLSTLLELQHTYYDLGINGFIGVMPRRLGTQNSSSSSQVY